MFDCGKPSIPEFVLSNAGQIAQHFDGEMWAAIESLLNPCFCPTHISEEHVCCSRIQSSDGAGLLYFARYPAMLNYGERVLLASGLGRPVSGPLHACLSAEHRRIFYFANANAGEKVRVDLDVRLLPSEADPAPGRYGTPFKLIVRGDLHRSSDGVLMASSLVRKALRVPAHAKAVLAEAERLLRAFA